MKPQSARTRLNDEGMSSSGPFSHRNNHPLTNAPVLNAGNQMNPPSAGVGASNPPMTSVRSRPVNRERSKSKRPQSRGRSKKPETRSWATVASGANKGYDLEFTPR